MEMIVFQKIRNTVIGIIVYQNGTKQSLLNFDVVRSSAVAWFWFVSNSGDGICHGSDFILACTRSYFLHLEALLINTLEGRKNEKKFLLPLSSLFTRG